MSFEILVGYRTTYTVAHSSRLKACPAISMIFHHYNIPFALGGINFRYFINSSTRMTMAGYLLLRNNKESGPYQLADLLSFGLKPYDLIWVEGKSAAWRYASEVEELKAFAPGVEEQPFDRFFKKNTQEKKEDTVVMQEKPVVREKPLEKQVETIEEKYQAYIPKKSVFVTLPGQKTVAVQKPATQDAQLQYQAKSHYQPEPERKTQAVATPVITVKENPEAQVKYSQPLDEIKEMYVKTLQERKSKIARKSFIIASLKKASVVAGLIAVGVLAGFIIKSGKADKPVLSKQTVLQSGNTTEPVKKADPPQQQLSSEQLNRQDLSLAAANLQNGPSSIDKSTPVSPEIEQRLLLLEKQQQLQQQSLHGKTKKQSEITEEKDQVETFDNNLAAGSDPVTGERKRIMRGDDNARQERAVMKPIVKTSKNLLDKQVSVISNDYKRVAFGGIRNLELTVVNDSKYVLDKVTVELQYLKPNEEPLKTEFIQFNTVSPNGSLTMRVKDTNRGIKVQYKIVDIQAAVPETAMSGF